MYLRPQTLTGMTDSPLTIAIIVLVRPLMVTALVLINPLARQGAIRSALLVRLMIVIEGRLLALLLPRISIFLRVHLLEVGQMIESPEISKFNLLLELGLLTAFGSQQTNLI